jgi:hypothetical protein
MSAIVVVYTYMRREQIVLPLGTDHPATLEGAASEGGAVGLPQQP